MNREEIMKNYMLIQTAELYNQSPDDKIFLSFSSEALEEIKRLAEALERAKDKGEIK